jgi:hypothetical protein
MAKHKFRKAGGAKTEFTPSGSVTAASREASKEAGHTMPGTDSFPINDKADLDNAKHAVGRAKNPEAARRWINKRAGDLGEPKLGAGKAEGGMVSTMDAANRADRLYSRKHVTRGGA